jgi:hypothetical protein
MNCCPSKDNMDCWDCGCMKNKWYQIECVYERESGRETRKQHVVMREYRITVYLLLLLLLPEQLLLQVLHLYGICIPPRHTHRGTITGTERNKNKEKRNATNMNLRKGRPIAKPHSWMHRKSVVQKRSQLLPQTCFSFSIWRYGKMKRRSETKQKRGNTSIGSI